MGINIVSAQANAEPEAGTDGKTQQSFRPPKTRRGKRGNAAVRAGRIQGGREAPIERGERGKLQHQHQNQQHKHQKHQKHPNQRLYLVDMPPPAPPHVPGHHLNFYQPDSNPEFTPASRHGPMSMASGNRYRPRAAMNQTRSSRGSFQPSHSPQSGIHVRSPRSRAAASMADYSKFSRILPPWTSWETLSITLSGLPQNTNTFTVWKSFEHCSPIDWIEIFQDTRGAREGRARLRFKPPPKERFWLDGKHSLELDDGQRVTISVHVDTKKWATEVPSPVNPDVLYPSSLTVNARFLEIGTLVEERSMLALRTIGSNHPEQISFTIDLARREINFFFQFTKYDSRPVSIRAPPAVQDYRIRVPFVQLSRIFRIPSAGDVSFVISLDSPPLYHRKPQDLKSTFAGSETSWRASDSWFRQTDIAHSPQDLLHAAISLRKPHALINIGRWTTFRLMFGTSDGDNKEKLEKLCNIFKDFNIVLEDIEDFKITQSPPTAPIAWQWIDPPSTHVAKRTSSLEDLAESEYTHIPFVVRYQLEVCMSHGYLSEYTIGKEFSSRLAALGEQKAKDLLEHVAGAKITYYDPMKIFDIQFFSGATNRRIPTYCCYMRSARVTPTTIYFNTPSVDITNRVVRHYIEYADRFLRIRFTDEKLEGRINSTYNNCMEEVFSRVKRTMMNGITIGDRHYEFLAFGNSQFREHGAYFFASLPNLTASNIRAWMGHFSDIKVIAKHAARLGQCFSTTRAVTGCPVQLREIDDIERNGYTFSDGVGRISRFLAQMVTAEHKIRTPSGEPPSVFQFRLGGCKGILTISPEAQRQEVQIRKSQYKFAAIHNGLEVIRHSQFAMASLNRQLIIVLSTLGIDDDVFISKLHQMLENLDLAMTSETKAINMLQKYVDPNQMTLLLAHMVHDGFQVSKEPFVTSLLELWRAWQIKYLKEKAKIVIEKGACLFGCVDETAKLKGFFKDNRPPADATFEQKLEYLPEIFVQVSHADHKGEYNIIEGPCIIARNPSLHPGDIRVVRAVNVPALHHLKDVIVFAQTGDRDVPSMCSGGDLDGDDYIVIWDQDLLPDIWFREPMDYSASKPEVPTRDVTVNDITSFFVTYMQNDRLPQIAHAHLAFADYLENGVDDDKCIRLANLHSAAVDYNKTGIPAKMGKDLVPRKWPHFMEKKYKPKEAQYVSRKILGRLYDIVERVDFRPKLEASFDERILNCDIKVSDELMATALEMKTLYDADMHRIMAQHEIKTEFEVWSTFVLSHANMSKDYKFHEELGQISSALRDRYLEVCYEKAGGKDFRSLAPLAVAMYKVTCNQMTEALAKEDLKEGEYDKSRPADSLPLISFPWVLQPVLGDIANNHYDASGVSGGPDIVSTNSTTHLQDHKRKPRADGGDKVPQDIETAGGIQHPGEILELFQGDPAQDPFSGLGDAFDKQFGDPKDVDTKSDKLNGEQNSKEKKTMASSNSQMNSLIDFDGDDFVPMSPTATEPSRQVKSPVVESSNLLDISDQLNTLSVSSAKAASTTTTTEGRLIQNGNNENKHPLMDDNPVSTHTPDTQKLEDGDEMEEIVEVKENIKPSAVDQLEQLLGF